MRYLVCAGMYRSCSTWQYAVASQLVVDRLGGIRLGFMEGTQFGPMRDGGNDEHSRPGVLKTHDASPSFDAAAWRVLYAYRDLRDVAFSYMAKFRVTFEEMASRGVLTKILENDAFWRAQPGVLCQRYEEIVSDPARGVAEIAGHLGLELSEKDCQALAREYSWEANLCRAMAVKRKAEREGVELGGPAGSSPHDPVTLLHWDHLRVGRGRNWRQLASRRECELLAQLCGHWLVANNYEADDSWVLFGRETMEDHEDRGRFLQVPPPTYPRPVVLFNRAVGRLGRLLRATARFGI